MAILLCIWIFLMSVDVLEAFRCAIVAEFERHTRRSPAPWLTEG